MMEESKSSSPSRAESREQDAARVPGVSRVEEIVGNLRDKSDEKLAHIRSRSWLISRIVETYERFRAGNGGECAAGLAYYAFLSLYPLLVSIASIMAIFAKDPDRVEQIMNQIIARISPGLVPLVAGSTDVISNSAAPLGLVATILFLWSAFKVIQVSQRSLSRIFGVDVRSLFKAAGSRMIFAIVALLAPVALMAVSIFLARIGPRHMGRGTWRTGGTPGKAIAYSVVLYLVDLALSIAIMKIVGGYRGHLKWLAQGAAITAAGWFLMQTLGVYLLQRFFTSWAFTFYGVAASNIALLIIANFGSRALIFGAEWAAIGAETPE